jgi:hypothetical protein
MNTRAFALCALLFLALPHSSDAAIFCVTTSAGLQNALRDAENNGQHDEIRIAIGIYKVPSTAGFTYNALATGDDALDLTISGGWRALSNNPCGQQLATDNAFHTLLDGDHRFRVLSVYAPQSSDLTVRNLWFADGNAGQAVGGGLQMLGRGTVGTNKFLVENCVFSGNNASSSAALYLSHVNEARVRNNLFVTNNATLTSWSVNITSISPGGIYFTNNTVIGNTTTPIDRGAGVRISAPQSESGSNQYFVANNILWDNAGADIQLIDSTGKDHFVHNDIGVRYGGSAAETEYGNISVAPVFAGSLIDFIPADGSPLINAGIRPPSFVPVPPPFHQAWSTGVLDLKGTARVRGGEIDIGAYEAQAPLQADGVR